MYPRGALSLIARSLPVALAALVAGCGGDSGEPTTLNLPGETSSPGARLVASSGCLACHRVGQNGNDGPGPDLTHIGSRIPRAAIARSLVSPAAPMPSYTGMPASDRAALVDYLTRLR